MFAGETKPFVSCMFAFEFPAQQEGSLPEMQVRVANVTRLISDRLDAAVERERLSGHEAAVDWRGSLRVTSTGCCRRTFQSSMIR